MSDNLAPADELFQVRAKLKELTERESQLRELMIEDAAARTGNNYAVEVKVVKTSRTDIKEMRAAHPDIVAQYTFPMTQIHIVLCGITDNGELVSLRRKACPERSVGETSDE